MKLNYVRKGNIPLVRLSRWCIKLTFLKNPYLYPAYRIIPHEYNRIK